LQYDLSGDLQMKTLFEEVTVQEVKGRMIQLRPDSQPLWGKMNPAQAMAHCSEGVRMSLGERPMPPRVFIGRLLGPVAKKSLIINGTPMRPNSPTDPTLIVAEERDFMVEQKRLGELIDHFAAAGPTACTRLPHFFFGKLTPVEWASLMYQHLDHHFRQFGV
jgi:hypothetical protein